MIDGSVTRTRTKTTIVNGRQTKVETEYEAIPLYHCNYGWGGTADGYYIYNVFNTATARLDREPDDSSYTGSYYYDRDIRVIKYSK